jgi:RNA 3'-terminal phosphate cyclase (ATP)
MLEIDGSQGEGGGQVLRTALALSLVTGTPFRLSNLRARRKNPGLRRQHLAAVQAAARVGAARVEGAEEGSRRVVFEPGAVLAGRYELDIGSAGSTTLVLQTVVPALLRAGGPSRVAVTGGTHNPLAPPWEFLEHVWLPLVNRLGAQAAGRLVRHGFYPAGGGRVEVEVEPAAALTPFELLERGPVQAREARAIVSSLPVDVARRELGVVRERLGWPPEALQAVKVAEPRGPGNALVLRAGCAHATEVVSACGERGLPAEEVAERAVRELLRWHEADVPVGEHLADQLLLLLALAGGGGRFRTLAPLSGHAVTQTELIPRFLPLRIESAPAGEKALEVRVSAA